MNNVPVMMLVVVTMRGLVHGCEIVIMNKQAGSNRWTEVVTLHLSARGVRSSYLPIV